jgi:hypothetical protein
MLLDQAWSRGEEPRHIQRIALNLQKHKDNQVNKRGHQHVHQQGGWTEQDRRDAAGNQMKAHSLVQCMDGDQSSCGWKYGGGRHNDRACHNGRDGDLMVHEWKTDISDLMVHEWKTDISDLMVHEWKTDISDLILLEFIRAEYHD